MMPKVRGPLNDERIVQETDREYTMEWTFGTFLWSMLVFFFWFAVIWMFIGVFADIFRRDMSGWAKAGWIFLIIVLPFLGVLIYVIARPRTADLTGEVGLWGPTPRRIPEYTPTEEIAKAAQLRDQGRISADEYEYLKQQALSHS
jgi:hypothetical protein